MDQKKTEEFWSSLIEIVPEDQADIREMLTTYRKCQTNPVKAQSVLLTLFDFIANSVPKQLWSERAWDFVDRYTER